MSTIHHECSYCGGWDEIINDPENRFQDQTFSAFSFDMKGAGRRNVCEHCVIKGLDILFGNEILTIDEKRAFFKLSPLSSIKVGKKAKRMIDIS